MKNVRSPGGDFFLTHTVQSKHQMQMHHCSNITHFI